MKKYLDISLEAPTVSDTISYTQCRLGTIIAPPSAHNTVVCGLEKNRTEQPVVSGSITLHWVHWLDHSTEAA